MPTTRSYYEGMAELLFKVGEVALRAMMGEYILYYKGKVIGGLYDDRLLLKPTAAAKELLPNAKLELPYPNAKPMVLVETADEKLLKELFEKTHKEIG